MNDAIDSEKPSSRKSRRREGWSELHTWLSAPAAFELKRLAAASSCSQRAMLEELIFDRAMRLQQQIKRRGRPRKGGGPEQEGQAEPRGC